MTTDGNNPEILTRLPCAAEAAAIVAGLAAQGIEASTTGGYTAGFLAEAPGDIQVIVRHRDLVRARKVLAELDQETSNIDWSQVDVGEADP